MVGMFENVGFKFGRWLDSVLMQRALGEGATTRRKPTSATSDSVDLSMTRSTRSSSGPRRTMRPVAEITL